MMEMRVKMVGVEAKSGTPVVIIMDLEEKGFIPLMVGHMEARAILTELEGERPPRPMSHDLIKSLLVSLQASVDHVVLCDWNEEEGYVKARVVLETAADPHEVDARPSDALALALRFQAPIYISDEVAQLAFIEHKHDEEADPEMEAFREFLQDVKPEDFMQE